MIILGAGMTGCLAGIINPQAMILEAQAEPPINHNAILRFRDDTVSKVTGIPFKEVTVRKAIVYNNKFREPDISLCNKYSLKVTGKVQDRSIWNLDTVKRYIAPPNFQKQLFDIVSDRVTLDHKIVDLNEVGIANSDSTIISTIPLTAMCKLIGIDYYEKLTYQKITVITATIPDCEVYQTIYFPDPDVPIYRASITGDRLILEFVSNDEGISYIDKWIEYIVNIFGIKSPVEISEQKIQNYGKISPVEELQRRQFLYFLTKEYNIYSAGRFAIWKNVLMDDVLKDLHVIKEMQAKDGYEQHRRL